MTIVVLSCNANVIISFNPIRKKIIQSNPKNIYSIFLGRAGSYSAPVAEQVGRAISLPKPVILEGNERLWEVSRETSQRVDSSSCRTKQIRPPRFFYERSMRGDVNTRRCHPPSTYEVLTSRSLSSSIKRIAGLGTEIARLISSSTGAKNDRARPRNIE